MDNKLCSKCHDPESKADHLGVCPKPCDKCNGRFYYAHHKHCPKCGSSPRDHEVRNYSMMWHEGDVYCIKCDTYVRDYDAG